MSLNNGEVQASSFVGIGEFWTVNVILKNSLGSVIDLSGGLAASPGVTLSFNVGPGFSYGSYPIVPNSQWGSDPLSTVSKTALLSALKTWAENADWNTGITWSDYGVTHTPVAYDSISIVDSSSTEPMTDNVTDITP